MADATVLDLSGRIAVLLMAYGTPRSPDEIEPYYTDIRRGRPPTAEQLADLVGRYEAIGGLSPLAQRTEAQRDALQRALDVLAPDTYTVAVGLKHADPRIETTIEQLAGQGIERIVAVVMAPHYSAGSVGQYVERTRAAAGPHGIDVVAIESWATEPAFVDFLAADVRRRLGGDAVEHQDTVHRPLAPDEDHRRRRSLSGRAQRDSRRRRRGRRSRRMRHNGRSRGRARAVHPSPGSGPTSSPSSTTSPTSEAADGVLVCACGFVADHLEVLYDLDIEARQRAESRGLVFDRTACVNDDPGVIDALAARTHELASR